MADLVRLQVKGPGNPEDWRDLGENEDSYSIPVRITDGIVTLASEQTLQAVKTAIEAQGGTGEPIDTYANTYDLLNGTLEEGLITDTFLADGTYLTLGEAVGTGLEVIVDFLMTGVKAEYIGIVGYYAGGGSHYVAVYAYNWDTLAYEEISNANNRMTSSNGPATYEFALLPAHTADDGTVRIKFLHNVTTYFATHRLYLDRLTAYYLSTGATQLKDSAGRLINPAKEDGNLQTLANKDFATQATMAAMNAKIPATPSTKEGNLISKKTVSLASSGTVHTPAAGKKIRVYNMKFSLSADLTDVAYKWNNGTAFEKYLAPKSGGLYGTNLHPNYLEGAVDEPLKCDITGTGTVQTNLEFIEI